MNTSSRPGSTSAPRRSPCSAISGASAASSAARVGAGDVQRRAERRHLLHRRHRRAAARRARRRPVAGRPTRSTSDWLAITSRAVPCASSLPFEDVAELVAALGLVHVVRADEHRDAARGELVQLVPEIAARLRIDAGGRLVEQQQLRLVQQARGERQALLPAARERAGELVRARSARPSRCERSHRPRCARRSSPYMRATKSQVLADRQVFPEREALRHVADVALDRLGFARGCRSRGTCPRRCRASAGRTACGSTSSCRCRSARGSRRSRRGAPTSARSCDDVIVAEALVEAAHVDDDFIGHGCDAPRITTLIAAASRRPAGPDAACAAIVGRRLRFDQKTSFARLSLE